MNVKKQKKSSASAVGWILALVFSSVGALVTLLLCVMVIARWRRKGSSGKEPEAMGVTTWVAKHKGAGGIKPVVVRVSAGQALEGGVRSINT